MPVVEAVSSRSTRAVPLIVGLPVAVLLLTDLPRAAPTRRGVMTGTRRADAGEPWEREASEQGGTRGGCPSGGIR